MDASRKTEGGMAGQPLYALDVNGGAFHALLWLALFNWIYYCLAQNSAA